MNIKPLLLTLALTLAIGRLSAQQYPVAAIPDSLLKHADAVIRFSECRFVQKTINTATATCTVVITLLNDEGKEHGDCVIGHDRFRELKSFSALVYDKAGKQIRKAGKSDLKTYGYSPHMATDDKYSVYEFHPSVYPVTIKYEYEVQHKNGIPAYPPFMPVDAYKLAVEKATLIVDLPYDITVRHKSSGVTPTITRLLDGTLRHEWTMENHKALTTEWLAPKLASLVPRATVAPNDFCMEGYCGSMRTWESLSAWEAGLQDNRTTLPEKDKEKVRALVANAATVPEKVKLLYQYLQANTRYISIQLGVGGFQPLSAESVAKSGFGDCKALSNYLRAMLSVVDIPSIYASVSTTNTNLYEDFASLTQMDHVVLAVPTDTDTLWLECTSSYLPFSYIHSGIAGHQAQLILPEGGTLCRIKQPDTDLPPAVSKLEVNLQADGNATATARERYRREGYEQSLDFVHSMTEEERINRLTKGIKLPKSKLRTYTYTMQGSEDPELTITYSFDVERLAEKSANRLFVPLSPLSYGFSKQLRKERVNDIDIRERIVTVDTLRVTMPDGYLPESLPQSADVETDFGSYCLQVDFADGTLTLIQHIRMGKNRFPASRWDEFCTFIKAIDKETSKKAVFRQV